MEIKTLLIMVTQPRILIITGTKVITGMMLMEIKGEMGFITNTTHLIIIGFYDRYSHLIYYYKIY
jgi:hypothetical protein